MLRTPNFKGSFHPFNIDHCRWKTKKIQVKYFFENYVCAKFYQNRRFRLRYVPVVADRDSKSAVAKGLHNCCETYPPRHAKSGNRFHPHTPGYFTYYDSAGLFIYWSSEQTDKSSPEIRRERRHAELTTVGTTFQRNLLNNWFALLKVWSAIIISKRKGESISRSISRHPLCRCGYHRDALEIARWRFCETRMIFSKLIQRFCM